ncbi:unnamed protein product [Clavelina lepadiformis]|uniref:Actin-interacting protein 1 n=2 Tax=Clavelina lepadiformis TaxID=159417 RepID=A0ABP0GAS0_CLALP
MVKISKKSAFAPLPPTTRATSLVMGADPKGKNFLYCTKNCVVIRDIENPMEFDGYYAHQKPPTCAKYSPSGFYICSGDSSGKIRIWDTTQAEHILKYEYQPISGKICDIAWDGENKRIAVCGQGREKFSHVFLWDSGSSVGTLSGPGKSCNSCDLKMSRPYRCIVASEDFNTYFYEGPPFKYKLKQEGTRFANCCRFSPDGKYYAAANSDGTIELCDGKTGEQIGGFGEPKAHDGGVYSICFSPDSSELLSASADKSCKIWNVESRETVVKFVMGNTIDDQQLSCLWQGKYLLTVSLSGDITYLNRDDPCKPLRVLSGHNKSISSLALKPNEAIFTASFDGNIVKWNPETGDTVRLSGKGHGTIVKAMVYNACENQLVSIGSDNKVRFTDCDSCVYSPDAVISVDSEPASMAITADEFIVVACEKEMLLIKDQKKLSAFPFKDNSHPVVLAVAGSKIIASGKKEHGHNIQGQICHVYDIGGHSITDTGVTFELRNKVSAIASSPDGARLAVADEKVIKIYEVCDGFKEKPKELHGHSNNCTSLAWAPDNQHLASGSIDNRLFVWDTSDQKNHSIIAHHKSDIRAVGWLNGNTLVSVADDAIVKQWTVSF